MRWLLLFSCSLFALDLEQNIPSFVLETKKIEIPGYPDAFNASIVPWQDAYLMSFRIIPDRKSSFTTYTGLIWLNDDFEPIAEPQILDFRRGLNTPSRAADARLIKVGERLYIVYEDNTDLKITRGGFRVYVGEIHQEGDRFTVENIHCLSKFPGANPDKREKSWVPFDYQGTLLLAYTLEPHRIFRPHFEECFAYSITDTALNWEYGIVRGGTPALEVDGQYLSFFHSVQEMETVHSRNQKSLHYFMGAYTFNLQPPFKIERISCEPIIAKGFYRHSGFAPFWHPVRAIFPCGYVVQGDYLWVAYGREDHEIWVIKLDKKGLLASLR